MFDNPKNDQSKTEQYYNDQGTAGGVSEDTSNEIGELGDENLPENDITQNEDTQE